MRTAGGREHRKRGVLNDWPATVQVQGMRLAGTLRLIPLPEVNMIAFSFAYPPSMELDLQAAVGNMGAKLGNVGFFKRAITSVLCKKFTEPRRRLTALHVKPPKNFNILQAFAAATVRVSLQSILAPALACSEVLVSMQIHKVRLFTPTLLPPSLPSKGASHLKRNGTCAAQRSFSLILRRRKCREGEAAFAGATVWGSISHEHSQRYRSATSRVSVRACKTACNDHCQAEHSAWRRTRTGRRRSQTAAGQHSRDVGTGRRW